MQEKEFLMTAWSSEELSAIDTAFNSMLLPH